MDNIRPTWDEYFKQLVTLTATRSSCERLHVGCLFIKDNRIVAQGYNGYIAGCEHKMVVRDNHNIATIHAEQNAIIQAAIHGVNIKGATLYCTNMPCSICTKMLINAQIVDIYYKEGYSDSLAADLLAEAGIVPKKIG